jgi:hypothetical protein
VAIDPDNRLLGRANRRRQDAEALHDALRFVSGRLDLEPATCTVPETFKGAGNQASTVNLAIPEKTLRKRAVYWPVFRKDVPVAMDMLGIFDMPVATGPRGARAVSVVPAQGLFLLNSPLVLDSAEALADDLRGDAGRTEAEGVEELYLRLYTRRPSAAERERALGFVARFAAELEQRGQVRADAGRAAWTRLCHTLLIANEFLVVE